MTKRKSYDEVSVVRSISKKASINVNTKGKCIEIAKNNTDVGNGTWGKIDYLIKVHDYIVIFMDSISKKKSINNSTDTNVERPSKTAKREAKLNMATMSKNAMKRVKAK